MPHADGMSRLKLCDSSAKCTTRVSEIKWKSDTRMSAAIEKTATEKDKQPSPGRRTLCEHKWSGATMLLRPEHVGQPRQAVRTAHSQWSPSNCSSASWPGSRTVRRSTPVDFSNCIRAVRILAPVSLAAHIMQTIPAFIISPMTVVIAKTQTVGLHARSHSTKTSHACTHTRARELARCRWKNDATQNKRFGQTKQKPTVVTSTASRSNVVKCGEKIKTEKRIG